MEPQYRFCTSADGTRIAYATFGSGPPLFFVNTWVLSIDAQFRWPEARAFFDALSARTTVVMLDRRGSGASTRDVADVSYEVETQDVLAVADAAGLEAFPMFCDAAGGSAVGARFAAGYPERVQRLVLWAVETSTGRGDVDREAARRVLEEWSYWRRRWAGVLFPDGPVSLQRAANMALKDSVSRETNARRFESNADADLRHLVPAVAQPVLVLARESGIGHDFQMQVASLLSQGELRFVPGFPPTPYPDFAEIVDATFEFIGVDERPPGRTQTATPQGSGTAVILFADVVDSTALAEQLGNTVYRERTRMLEERVRAAISSNGGAPVEGRTLGDGVLGVFTSASDAISAALQCALVGEELGLALHLGLHAGDVIREEGNVHGQAVSIASRVSDLSAPNEVLVSSTVRDLARASAGVTFEDRGEHELKGIAEPQRLWAVKQLDA
ncbi:MAG: adenylate/guanylate cyclase domain-containing protein [Dehalococcoidia bacterium]